MPLYDYSCEKCGKRFELMRSMSDNSQVTCPDCASVCKKNVTTTSFMLKGTGWYKTDYTSSGTAGTKTTHSPSCGCCHKASDGTCGI